MTHIASTQPVRYIVEHKVDDAVCQRFEEYMNAHLGEVGSTGCFLCASLEKMGAGHYRLVWLLQNMQSLEKFQRDHAPPMRADFALQFPEGVKSTRTHSVILATWFGVGRNQLI